MLDKINSIRRVAVHYEGTVTPKFKAKPKNTQLRGRKTTSEIQNQVISNVNKLHCARWFVKIFCGNRTLCLPHCLSLFGTFIYRPIHTRAFVATLSDRLAVYASLCSCCTPRMAYVGGTTPPQKKKSACFARSNICTPTIKIVAPPLLGTSCTVNCRRHGCRYSFSDSKRSVSLLRHCPLRAH